MLPEPYAGATAAGLVFVFSFMIMLGLATRVATLMIALMTFFSSYLAMIALGVTEELGAFWRDIALIAALLLTYGEHSSYGARRRRLVRRQVLPRRVGAILAQAAADETAMDDLRHALKQRPRRLSPDRVNRLREEPSLEEIIARSEADLPPDAAFRPLVTEPVAPSWAASRPDDVETNPEVHPAAA